MTPGLTAHAAELQQLREVAKASKPFAADFTHEVEGVPFEVEVEYEPSEPHCSATVEIQRIRVAGSDHDIGHLLDRTTLAVLDARAEILKDEAEKRRRTRRVA
jgi:hypothetical protein